MCRSAHAQLPRHNQYGMDSGRRMSDIMTNLLSFVGSSWKTISSRPKSSSGKKIASGNCQWQFFYSCSTLDIGQGID